MENTTKRVSFKIVPGLIFTVQKPSIDVHGNLFERGINYVVLGVFKRKFSNGSEKYMIHVCKRNCVNLDNTVRSNTRVFELPIEKIGSRLSIIKLNISPTKRWIVEKAKLPNISGYFTNVQNNKLLSGAVGV